MRQRSIIQKELFRIQQRSVSLKAVIRSIIDDDTRASLTTLVCTICEVKRTAIQPRTKVTPPRVALAFALSFYLSLARARIRILDLGTFWYRWHLWYLVHNFIG